MFVHLVDPNGKVVAGYDSAPRKGKLPTSEWVPLGLTADAIVLPIDNVPTGTGYEIKVGWYDAATQQRLFVVDASGRPVIDAILIDSFSVIE